EPEVVPLVAAKEDAEAPEVKPVGNKLKEGMGPIKKTPKTELSEEQLDLQLVEKDPDADEEPVLEEYGDDDEEVDEEDVDETPELPLEVSPVAGQKGKN